MKYHEFDRVRNRVNDTLLVWLKPRDPRRAHVLRRYTHLGNFPEPDVKLR